MVTKARVLAAVAGTLRVLAGLVATVLILAGAAAIGSALWIQHEFGIITYQQAIINLHGAGTDGAGGASVVTRGMTWGIVVPLLVAVLAVSCWIFLWTRMRSSRRSRRVLAVYAVVAAITVPLAGLEQLSLTFSLEDYVKSVQTTRKLSDYYVMPEIGAADGQSLERPLNLVLIYLESTEDTLRDTEIFEENMLAPLDTATAGWQSVSQFQEYYGGGFTMSGIVSTQCGIPLRTGDIGPRDGDAINALGGSIDDYLPGAVCLGDILDAEGYRAVFMGGASGAFSGKHQFFLSHGYDEVYGWDEWTAAGETEVRMDWGLSDRRLMENAQEKVTELHDSGQPFLLTLLTLDTHPAQYGLPYCDITTENPSTSIYRCSMEQVAAFVTYMDQAGYLEDTAVVIMGDHLRLAPPSDPFHEELAAVDNRTIYNRIWSPRPVDLNGQAIDQISMFPTILEMLGVELPSGRAGLGVSALQVSVSQDAAQSLPEEEYIDLLRSRSADFYDRMWRQISEHSRLHGRVEMGLPTPYW